MTRPYNEKRPATKKGVNKTNPVIEELAELEHEQWMKWSQTVGTRVDDATRERWKAYWVPYAALSEPIKEFDREWARKILERIGTILGIEETKRNL